jgi:acyl-CoA synthetase (NDP forming)
VHLDPARRFAATFLRDLPPGAAVGATNGLAFISQSGALAEEFIDKANARGLPLTSVVSVGNAVHLGVEDYLGWLGERPEIGAALLYVESIEDHERFRDVARKVSARKPVIALFGGRTEIAHTGAVANDDAAIDAFCASCGVVRVKSLRRLLIAAKAFGRFPQGLGPRALILSNSGGPGVLCADRASLEGLDLAALPSAMADVLRQQLPAEASVANPIDLLADAREDRFGLALEAALTHAARSYDMVMMIHVVLHGRRAARHRAAGRTGGRGSSLLVPQHDGHPPRQGGMVRHHGASRGADVQRCRGNGRSGRAAGALSDSSRCSKIGKVAHCDLW